MKKLIITLLVLSALLTGCQEAPENIQKEVDLLDRDSSVSDDNSTSKIEIKERGTIEEIRNQLATDLENNTT